MIGASFETTCPCYGKRNSEDVKRCSNTRYLLVMTEEYSALPIIQQMFLKDRNDIYIIFGSSFPKDQEFTQVLNWLIHIHARTHHKHKHAYTHTHTRILIVIAIFAEVKICEISACGIKATVI